jgi:hypothetical protein
MKVYYAHCMALYDTPQEKRDVQTLKLDLGWDVLNPNCPEHRCGAVQAREEAPHDPHASMLYFKPLVESCNLLAFRALPDGAIPAGVFMEIKWARDAGIPVIELPSGVRRRGLTREQTREYIKEVGRW